MKSIPDWIFKKWHTTGTQEHVYPNVSGQGKNTCKLCGVNLVGEKYGCQGMKFDEWYKININEKDKKKRLR